MGTVHSRVYSELARTRPGRLDIIYVDRDSAKAEKLASQFGGRVLPDLEAALGEADALDLCLPTDVHCEIALQVIAAKKPVLCEKPLARTLAEGRKMVEAVRAAGSFFMPAQVVRFFPEFRRIHDLVKSGAVGNAAVIRTRRGGGTPKGSDLWFLDHARSGGVLIDIGVHDFDWILWTFGPVAEVSARARTVTHPEGPDYALTTLTLESGALAHVESTWMDPAGFRTTVEVAGNEGLLQYDSRAAASVKTIVEGRTAYEMNMAPGDDPFYKEMEAFVEALEQGAPPPVSIEEGFNALAVAVAALDSAQTGKKVKPAFEKPVVSVPSNYAS